MEQKIHMISIFPSPVYITKRDVDLNLIEKTEIEDVIKEGMNRNLYNTTTKNNYIFDTVLYNLKKFCEEHIKIYVEQVINPENELDFYITQSWINVVEPGGNIEYHYHANSIISGVFYISTEEDDSITFLDPNIKVREPISFSREEFNVWNSTNWTFPVNNNELVLFPSWLTHQVDVNGKATTDRISLSFNTFVKGTLGGRSNLNELILK